MALEIHNNTPFSGRDYSRRQQFEDIERTALGKLNVLRYQIKEQKVVTVMKNSYVRLPKDVHYNSVAFNYIGKKVKMLYTSQQVEVYYRYDLIAQHIHSYRRHQYTTNEEHLASKHKFLAEWCPENFIKKGTDIHEDVGYYIGKILEYKPYPEQAYKSCSGVLSFARRVGEERLTAACRWADSLGQYSYRIIEEILHKRLDQLQKEEEAVRIPSHTNIRGKEYYQ